MVFVGVVSLIGGLVFLLADVGPVALSGFSANIAVFLFVAKAATYTKQFTKQKLAQPTAIYNISCR